MLKDLENVDSIRSGAKLKLPLLQTATAQYRTYVKERGAGDAETFSIPRLYHP